MEINIMRINSGKILLWSALILLSACGCTNRAEELVMNWEPIDSLNSVLPEGVRVYDGHNDGLPIQAWYVKIREGDTNVTTRVVVSADEDRKETASQFAERLGACVVVNGGYFRMDKNPATHVGLLMVDGEVHESATRSVIRDTLRFYIARAALGITENGLFDVAWVSNHSDTVLEWKEPRANTPFGPAPVMDYAQADQWIVRDALSGGPGLVFDGEIRITSDEEVFFGTSIPKIHPRTAAGYTKEGDLILLVVDGRQSDSRGVNLSELATLMYDLGCVEALNLDGGGSATLVVNGILLNRPTGGTFEREVMSALAVFCD